MDMMNVMLLNGVCLAWDTLFDRRAPIRFGRRVSFIPWCVQERFMT